MEGGVWWAWRRSSPSGSFYSNLGLRLYAERVRDAGPSDVEPGRARRAVPVVDRQFDDRFPGRDADRDRTASSRACAQPLLTAERAESSRRHFLENAATAAPFVAGAYGLLYGRLNLETTEQPIRLPRPLCGFRRLRICQLSDIHIDLFMPAEEIRKYVTIANSLKADLMVLTGDFVTFDPTTQQAVVEALQGLRAPFGVYATGNHDAWTRVEDSITALFRQTGVRILRGANVPIAISGESVNYRRGFPESRHAGPSPAAVDTSWDISLISRDRSHIRSHNPDTDLRRRELGIEFVWRSYATAARPPWSSSARNWLRTAGGQPYVAGLFQKPGGQLYVNRGIGTIGIPIRIGAPPEITVYKLTRG